jgi:hypothetical protein
LQELAGFKGWPAGQQFVEQNSQTIDVTAGIDIHRAHFRLLRTHVSRGADELFVSGKNGVIREPALSGFGDAKIDHLGNGNAIEHGDQDI